METKDFIGKDFWSFFNELPMWHRKKEVQETYDGLATLLVTNQKTKEQYKVVCHYESVAIRTYSFVSGYYYDFGQIVSITKE